MVIGMRVAPIPGLMEMFVNIQDPRRFEAIIARGCVSPTPKECVVDRRVNGWLNFDLEALQSVIGEVPHRHPGRFRKEPTIEWQIRASRMTLTAATFPSTRSRRWPSQTTWRRGRTLAL